MAFGVGDFLNLFRTVDRLLALERRHNEIIQDLDREVRTLADRVTKLEARETLLIAEAKAAASAAASVASTQHLTDLARHVGILEERTRRIDATSRKSITAERDD